MTPIFSNQNRTLFNIESADKLLQLFYKTHFTDPLDHKKLHKGKRVSYKSYRAKQVPSNFNSILVTRAYFCKAKVSSFGGVARLGSLLQDFALQNLSHKAQRKSVAKSFDGAASKAKNRKLFRNRRKGLTSLSSSYPSSNKISYTGILLQDFAKQNLSMESQSKSKLFRTRRKGYIKSFWGQSKQHFLEDPSLLPVSALRFSSRARSCFKDLHPKHNFRKDSTLVNKIGKRGNTFCTNRVNFGECKACNSFFAHLFSKNRLIKNRVDFLKAKTLLFIADNLDSFKEISSTIKTSVPRMKVWSFAFGTSFLLLSMSSTIQRQNRDRAFFVFSKSQLPGLHTLSEESSVDGFENIALKYLNRRGLLYKNPNVNGLVKNIASYKDIWYLSFCELWNQRALQNYTAVFSRFSKSYPYEKTKKGSSRARSFRNLKKGKGFTMPRKDNQKIVASSNLKSWCWKRRLTVQNKPSFVTFSVRLYPRHAGLTTNKIFIQNKDLVREAGAKNDFSVTQNSLSCQSAPLEKSSLKNDSSLERNWLRQPWYQMHARVLPKQSLAYFCKAKVLPSLSMESQGFAGARRSFLGLRKEPTPLQKVFRTKAFRKFLRYKERVENENDSIASKISCSTEDSDKDFIYSPNDILKNLFYRSGKFSTENGALQPLSQDTDVLDGFTTASLTRDHFEELVYRDRLSFLQKENFLKTPQSFKVEGEYPLCLVEKNDFETKNVASNLPYQSSRRLFSKSFAPLFCKMKQPPLSKLGERGNRQDSFWGNKSLFPFSLKGFAVKTPKILSKKIVASTSKPVLSDQKGTKQTVANLCTSASKQKSVLESQNSRISEETYPTMVDRSLSKSIEKLSTYFLCKGNGISNRFVSGYGSPETKRLQVERKNNRARKNLLFQSRKGFHPCAKSFARTKQSFVRASISIKVPPALPFYESKIKTAVDLSKIQDFAQQSLSVESHGRTFAKQKQALSRTPKRGFVPVKEFLEVPGVLLQRKSKQSKSFTEMTDLAEQDLDTAVPSQHKLNKIPALKKIPYRELSLKELEEVKPLFERVNQTFRISPYLFTFKRSLFTDYTDYIGWRKDTSAAISIAPSLQEDQATKNFWDSPQGLPSQKTSEDFALLSPSYPLSLDEQSRYSRVVGKKEDSSVASVYKDAQPLDFSKNENEKQRSSKTDQNESLNLLHESQGQNKALENDLYEKDAPLLFSDDREGKRLTSSQDQLTDPSPIGEEEEKKKTFTRFEWLEQIREAEHLVEKRKDFQKMAYPNREALFTNRLQMKGGMVPRLLPSDRKESFFGIANLFPKRLVGQDQKQINSQILRDKQEQKSISLLEQRFVKPESSGATALFDLDSSDSILSTPSKDFAKQNRVENLLKAGVLENLQKNNQSGSKGKKTKQNLQRSGDRSNYISTNNQDFALQNLSHVQSRALFAQELVSSLRTVPRSQQKTNVTKGELFAVQTNAILSSFPPVNRYDCDVNEGSRELTGKASFAQKPLEDRERVVSFLGARQHPVYTPNRRLRLRVPQSPLSSQNNNPQSRLDDLNLSQSHRWWQKRRTASSLLGAPSKRYLVMPEIRTQDWKKIIEWQLKTYFLEEEKRLEPLLLQKSGVQKTDQKPFVTVTNNRDFQPKDFFKIKKIAIYLPWTTLKKPLKKPFEWPVTNLSYSCSLQEIPSSPEIVSQKQKVLRGNCKALKTTASKAKPFIVATSPKELTFAKQKYARATPSKEFTFAKQKYTREQFSRVDKGTKLSAMSPPKELSPYKKVQDSGLNKTLFISSISPNFKSSSLNLYTRKPLDLISLQNRGFVHVTKTEPVKTFFSGTDDKSGRVDRFLNEQSKIVLKQLHQNSVYKPFLFEGKTKDSYLLLHGLALAVALKQLLMWLGTGFGKVISDKIKNSTLGLALLPIFFNARFRKNQIPEFSRLKKRLNHLLGNEDTISALSNLVWYLRNSCRGRLVPRGVVLVETASSESISFLKAVGGEAQVPVIVQSLRALPFTQSHPQRHLEKILTFAQKRAPCILFLDDLDSIGQARTALFQKGNGARKPNEVVLQDELYNFTASNQEAFEKRKWKTGGTDFDKSSNHLSRVGISDKYVHAPLKRVRDRAISKHDSTSSSFLKESRASQLSETASLIEQRRVDLMLRLLTVMDGISQLHGVLIVTTSKNPTSLDPALLRPGRFEKLINIKLPSKKKRIFFLKSETARLGCTNHMPWQYLGTQTQEMTGTEIASAINHSAFRAILQSTVHTFPTLEYGIGCVKGEQFSADNKAKLTKVSEPSSQAAFYRAGKTVLESLILHGLQSKQSPRVHGLQSKHSPQVHGLQSKHSPQVHETKPSFLNWSSNSTDSRKSQNGLTKSTLSRTPKRGFVQGKQARERSDETGLKKAKPFGGVAKLGSAAEGSRKRCIGLHSKQFTFGDIGFQKLQQSGLARSRQTGFRLSSYSCSEHLQRKKKTLTADRFWITRRKRPHLWLTKLDFVQNLVSLYAGQASLSLSLDSTFRLKKDFFYTTFQEPQFLHSKPFCTVLPCAKPPLGVRERAYFCKILQSKSKLFRTRCKALCWGEKTSETIKTVKQPLGNWYRLYLPKIEQDKNNREWLVPDSFSNQHVPLLSKNMIYNGSANRFCLQQKSIVFDRKKHNNLRTKPQLNKETAKPFEQKFLENRADFRKSYRFKKSSISYYNIVLSCFYVAFQNCTENRELLDFLGDHLVRFKNLRLHEIVRIVSFYL